MFKTYSTVRCCCARAEDDDVAGSRYSVRTVGRRRSPPSAALPARWNTEALGTAWYVCYTTYDREGWLLLREGYTIGFFFMALQHTMTEDNHKTPLISCFLLLLQRH